MLNRVATVEVPDSACDNFLGALLERLDGHGTASMERAGALRRIERTVDATAAVASRLVEFVGEAAEASGADMVFARFTDGWLGETAGSAISAGSCRLVDPLGSGQAQAARLHGPRCDDAGAVASG